MLLLVNMNSVQHNIFNPPNNYLFPVKEIEAFDRDAKHSTWFLRSCAQQNLVEFWMIGIPAESACFSLLDLYIDDESDSDYDMKMSVVYINLKYAMSASELKSLYANAKHPDYCLYTPGQAIEVPAMRPCNSDFKIEDEYIVRNQHWRAQWHVQKYTEFTEFEMPKQAPEALAPPAQPELALVVAAVVENQIAIVASAPKRLCPNGNLQDALANKLGPSAMKIHALLHVAMNAESIAKALGLEGLEIKRTVNKMLYQLRAAGMICLVSGWGFSAESTGKPMWRRV